MKGGKPMFFEKVSRPSYMDYSAQEFAKDNNLLYVPTSVKDLKIADYKRPGINPLLLAENRCMLLHPPNDGLPTCPVYFYKKTKNGRHVEVIDNRRAFSEIANISEILLKMTKLYKDHIEDQIFLDPMCFAAVFTDRTVAHYHGRGKLAVIDDTLCNNNVEPENQDDARKHFYNEFLGHFIGWNFGKAVNKNEELGATLVDIVRILKEKGLREEAGPGFRVWGSKDVWHVKYTDDKTPKIIRF